MKLFKKITLLSLAALTALGMGVASACVNDVTSSSSSSLEEVEEQDYVCRVKVENATGYGFKGVEVALYDGETEIRSEKTNSDGYATFAASEIEIGRYTVRLSGVPEGYDLADPEANYKIEAWKGFQLDVELEPQGLLSNELPQTNYKLGDVMHDFTLTTSDGDIFTLSEVLKEKEMVLINFWATWCGPCKQEFPAMNNAYIQYRDKIEVLAISTDDDMDAVKDFRSQNGLQFKMTSDLDSGTSLKRFFPSAGIPLSVMVDRYGVITFYHAGSMTEAKDFTSRFDKFLGEDYEPTIIVGSGDVGGDSGGNEGGSNLIAPTVPAPSAEKIKDVLANGSNDFAFYWQPKTNETTDPYSWPWLVSEDNSSVYSPIAAQSIHGNYSTLCASFTAGPGDAIFFDYLINSESTDILHVLVDGVPTQRFSGAQVITDGSNELKWTENYGGYYFKEDSDLEGEHEIVFLYIKDGDTSIDRESAILKNLRLERDVDPDSLNSIVFRHAANIENTDANAKTLYKHYITPVFNQTDGYYHVGSADGPLLFANLMLSSRWSDATVWSLAYSNYIVAEGYNFSDDVEDHAWAASQSIPGYEFLNGYAPVTEDLKELLEYATRISKQSFGISSDNKEIMTKHWAGDWHENEWLEICSYYDNYGTAKPVDDPMKTITFHAAVQVYEGENTANILYNMVPRGFKYKFIPEKDGVYNIYSTAELNAYADPVCFYFGDDTKTYEYYDEVLHSQVGDGNFNFHVYMEAGKTYYFAMATYADVSGSYNFHIDYYEGDYKYLTNCATYEVFNEVTQETYLADSVDYAYDEENDVYRVRNKDGSLGSIIYVDMLLPTMFFQSNSLYETAKNALLSYAEQDRAFYVNGTDYSGVIAEYGHRSYFAKEYEGYVPLNQELFEALEAITGKFDGIENSWQMLCYYEVVLGK